MTHKLDIKQENLIWSWTCVDHRPTRQADKEDQTTGIFTIIGSCISHDENIW